MIAATRPNDPVLALVRSLNPRCPDDLQVARCALTLIGARLDEESTLTPVFVPRASDRQPDGGTR